MKIKAIPFYGHTKPNGWMSNFYKSPIKFDDLSFSTSEQMFMWKKAMYFNDSSTARAILLAKTPVKAKALGRQVINYNDEEWKNYRGIAMTAAVYEKFRQNDDLKELLLNTGDYFLVEATRNDKIWGIGLDVDDDRLYDTDNWKGFNLLGSCLMTVRNMLRNDTFPIFDILPRLWSDGYTTKEQNGEWWLFDSKGEGIVSGRTFRDLCVNIVLRGL